MKVVIRFDQNKIDKNSFLMPRLTDLTGNSADVPGQPFSLGQADIPADFA